MYYAEIKAKKDIAKLYALFLKEQSERERSKFRIKKTEKELIFAIEAKDSVALRATINGITQILTAYEEMKKLSNG